MFDRHLTTTWLETFINIKFKDARLQINEWSNFLNIEYHKKYCLWKSYTFELTIAYLIFQLNLLVVIAQVKKGLFNASLGSLQ